MISEGYEIVIFDTEEAYVRSLTEYAGRKKNLPVRLVGFSEVKSLLSFAEKHKVETLLASASLPEDAVELVHAERVLFLDDGRGANSVKHRTVFKYMPAGELLKQLTLYTAKDELRKNSGRKRKGCDFYAVYSPVGGCRKTSFALTLAKLLSKERSVLYVNLENHSGLSEVLGTSFPKSISDLLYYIRLQKTGVSELLSVISVSVSGMDVLPPPDNYADILCTNPKEWQVLMDSVEETGVYEAVVLDIGDGVSDLYGMCERSVRVFVPLRTDPVSKAKYKEFTEKAKAFGKAAVANRAEPLYLPYITVSGIGRDYPDSLIWSPMGDTVRTLLMKKSEDGNGHSSG